MSKEIMQQALAELRARHIAALEAELAKPEHPDLRKAAEMALEALEKLTDKRIFTADLAGYYGAAISSLRQALAQPEQEPVAWMYNGHLHECDPSDWAEEEVTPLYKAPPRKWVGLTDDEIISSSKFFDYMTNEELIDAVRELETKLKDKNNG
jgi:hypothetical protein